MLPQLFIFNCKRTLDKQIMFFELEKERQRPKHSGSKVNSASDANSDNVNSADANSPALRLPEVDLTALEKTQRYHMEVYDDFYQEEDLPFTLGEIKDFVTDCQEKIYYSLGDITLKVLENLIIDTAATPASLMLNQIINKADLPKYLCHRLICYFTDPNSISWEVLKLLETMQNSYNEFVEKISTNPFRVKMEVVCLGAGAETESLLHTFINGEFTFTKPDKQHLNPPQPLKLKLYYTGVDSSGYEHKLNEYEHYIKQDMLQLAFQWVGGKVFTKSDKKLDKVFENLTIGIGKMGLVFGSEPAPVDYQEIFNDFYPGSELKFIPTYRVDVREQEFAEICKRHEAQLAAPVVFKSQNKTKSPTKSKTPTKTPRIAPLVYWFAEERTFNLAMKYLGDNFLNSQKPVIIVTPSVAKFADSRFGLRRIKSTLDSEFPNPKNQPLYDPVQPMSFIMEKLTSLQDSMVFSDSHEDYMEVMEGLSRIVTKGLIEDVSEEGSYYDGCELYQIVKLDDHGAEIEPNQQFPIVLATKYFSYYEIEEALGFILRAKYYY